MKKLIFILALGLFTSCNDIGVTEQEKVAVQNVLDFYGGICHRSKGFNTENDKTITYFELKMTESEILESYADKIEMPASNIAFLFYSNLGLEKKNYDEIHTIIVFNDGTERNFDYSADELELVNKRMSLVNKTVELLSNKDFKSIKNLLNNKYLKFDKDELTSNLEVLEPQLGEIKEFLPYGFRINELKDGVELLHISGVLIREIQDNNFSIDIDLNSENEEIFNLEYKL